MNAHQDLQETYLRYDADHHVNVLRNNDRFVLLCGNR